MIRPRWASSVFSYRLSPPPAYAHLYCWTEYCLQVCRKASANLNIRSCWYYKIRQWHGDGERTTWLPMVDAVPGLWCHAWQQQFTASPISSTAWRVVCSYADMNTTSILVFTSVFSPEWIFRCHDLAEDKTTYDSIFMACTVVVCLNLKVIFPCHDFAICMSHFTTTRIVYGIWFLHKENPNRIARLADLKMILFTLESVESARK